MRPIAIRVDVAWSLSTLCVSVSAKTDEPIQISIGATRRTRSVRPFWRPLLAVQDSGVARNFRQRVRQSVAFLSVNSRSAALPSRPITLKNHIPNNHVFSWHLRLTPLVRVRDLWNGRLSVCPFVYLSLRLFVRHVLIVLEVLVQFCRAFNCRILYDHYLPTVILLLLVFHHPPTLSL